MSLVNTVRAAIMLACSCLSAISAQASDWPTRSVRIIVPSTPAGTIDVIARLVAQKLSEKWGQPVVVDNRPGADGIIGTQVVAQAAPDGYTLLVVTTGLTTNPLLYKSVSYDPIKDFVPITILGSSPNVLLVNPSAPFSTLPELIALAKKEPGKLQYGSSGVGSGGQLSVALLETIAQVKFTHVPYKGAGAALNGVVAGEVPMLVTSVSGALPFIKSGMLIAAAVTPAKRLSALPEVPTFMEAGVKDYDVTGWYGILAPAKTPKEVVDKIYSDIKEILAGPDLSKRLDDLGFDIDPPQPSAFATFLASELVRWKTTISAGGIKVE